MKKALVVPHHHDNLDFLKEWPSFEHEFDTIYIILDRPLFKGFDDNLGWSNLKFYDHKSIDGILGKNSWIISRRDSAIRSFGYWLAWRDGHELIYTLDNDCAPDRKDNSYWIKEHEINLTSQANINWTTTGPAHHERTRGLPYYLLNSPVVLSHGLWSNVPDLDALEQLTNPQQFLPCEERKVIPKGQFFPMCGMNLAFNRDVAPLMYFGLQGPEEPYSRFDDIWAGLFAKKVLDHINGAVISGKPSVKHLKQSDPLNNLRKETPGILVNEELWKRIDEVNIPTKHNTPVEAYEWLIKNINFEGLDNPLYWRRLQEATLKWLELYV